MGNWAAHTRELVSMRVSGACTLRKAAVVCVAVCSIAAGTYLVWALVTREQVPLLSNATLVAMLALFTLPGATWAAWELDRHAARKGSAGPAPRQAPLVPMPRTRPPGAVGREDRVRRHRAAEVRRGGQQARAAAEQR